MLNYFTLFVQAIEDEGIKGHSAYEIANQIDKAYYIGRTDNEVRELAKITVKEELDLRQALKDTDQDV